MLVFDLNVNQFVISALLSKVKDSLLMLQAVTHTAKVVPWKQCKIEMLNRALTGSYMQPISQQQLCSLCMYLKVVYRLQIFQIGFLYNCALCFSMLFFTVIMSFRGKKIWLKKTVVPVRLFDETHPQVVCWK